MTNFVRIEFPGKDARIDFRQYRRAVDIFRYWPKERKQKTAIIVSCKTRISDPGGRRELYSYIDNCKNLITKCIIIDDEPLAAQLLLSYIERTDDVQCLGVFSTAMDAFVFLDKNPVDFALLDIEMPGISGINFIRSLKDPPKVIFVTAYPDFAVDAFELAAVDYLMKPVSYERFLKAIDHFGSKFSIAQKDTHAVPESFFIKVDRRLVRIDFASILYIESAGDYCKIHTDKKTYITYVTMSKIQGMLPAEDFTRIHRSTIVRDKCTEYIEGNMLQLGNHRLPIGLTYKDDILRKLNRGF